MWSEYRGLDLRDLYRRGGGGARLTYRLVADLIEQLPPESRTKTAIRNDMDPVELAAQVDKQPVTGWGPHGYLAELVTRVGEAIDMLRHDFAASNGGSPAPPPRWRRPGVLGEVDIAALRDVGAEETRAQVEAERVAREAVRVARKAAEEQARQGDN